MTIQMVALRGFTNQPNSYGYEHAVDQLQHYPDRMVIAFAEFWLGTTPILIFAGVPYDLQ
jgi:hypothetical protein